MIAIRLPDDLAAWLKRQGNQTAAVVAALEMYREGRGPKNNGLVRGPDPESPRKEATKRRPVRTKTVKVWEDGYEYEREVPIS